MRKQLLLAIIVALLATISSDAETIRQTRAPALPDELVALERGTFNLISYGKLKEQPETVLARWNSTETYARLGGRWKIVHSHWSFTTPNVKPLSQS